MVVRLVEENRTEMLRDTHLVYMDLETLADATKNAKRILDGCPFLNRQAHGFRRFLESMREAYVTACAFAQRQSQMVNHYRAGLHNHLYDNRVLAHENREIMRFFNPDFSAETNLLRVVASTVLGKNAVLAAIRDLRADFRDLIDMSLSPSARRFADRLTDTGTPSPIGNLSTFARMIFLDRGKQLREYPTFDAVDDNELE